MWQNSKFEMGQNQKKSKCEKTQNSKCDPTQKPKIWQNSKLNYDKTKNIKNGTKLKKKIPHTGDKASLDRCG